MKNKQDFTVMKNVLFFNNNMQTFNTWHFHLKKIKPVMNSINSLKHFRFGGLSSIWLRKKDIEIKSDLNTFKLMTNPDVWKSIGLKSYIYNLNHWWINWNIEFNVLQTLLSAPCSLLELPHIGRTSFDWSII